jgi:hypothetical protein
MTNYVGKKVLVRGPQSGAYFGELISQDKQEVEMKNVCNLWRWNGTAHARPGNATDAGGRRSMQLFDCCKQTLCERGSAVG